MGGQSAKETKSAQRMLLKIQCVCILDFNTPPPMDSVDYLMNDWGWQFVFPSPDKVAVVGLKAD